MPKDSAKPILIAIGGPTAVGKTRVAIALAQHFQTVIINADSRQVYREMAIGVGRPSEAELHSVPHHLIGHVSIHDHYSVGHFKTEVENLLAELFIKHKVVIVTGGTGLYLKAITGGLDDIPEIPFELIEKWTTIYQTEGRDVLLQKLAKVDPDYLNFVDQHNPARLIRAIAVSTHTGQPYSSFRKGKDQPLPFQFLPILLTRSREDLYARINQRVLDMMDQGWMEEAKTLYPHRHLKALQTLGYKELFEVIEGSLSLENAIPQIQQATRRYAKRQLTWYRHQGEWNEFHPEDLPGILNWVQSKVEDGN